VSAGTRTAKPAQAVAVLAGAALTFAVGQTLMVPALPAIQTEFGVAPQDAAWLITAFLLTASVTIPLAGRLGDMYGKTRLLLASFGVYIAGNAVGTLGALEHSYGALIAGRAIAGIGAGIVPLALGIVRDVVPPARVTLGVGLVASTQGVGIGLGILSSGLIVDHASIALIFAGSVPVAAFFALATWRVVPERTERREAKLDRAGAALLSVALLALLLAVNRGNPWGWTSAGVLALFAASAVATVAWIWWERRAEDPLVDLEMMRDRTVWTTNVVTIGAGFAMFSGFMLVPQLVHVPEASGYGFGASGTATGLFMLPHSAMMLVAGTVGGVLGTHFGSKTPLAIGSTTAAISYTLLAFFHEHPIEIYVALGLMGLGVGLTLSSVASLTVQAVRRRQTGVAMGMNAIMRMVGGAIGAQIVATILTGHPGFEGFPSEAGFTIAFAVSAVAALITLALVLAVPSRPEVEPGQGAVGVAAAGV
jgi:MFS family permease